MALAPPATQVRPYRDFLTPALHRRFNKASLSTLVLCYAIAIWQGDWESVLWALLPIGPVGIRALLVFIPALIIYVLRVSQWHVGRRHTQTPLETARKHALRWSTLATLAFYLTSAFVYSEAYIWSRSPDDKLGFTDTPRAHERPKLNERSFYVRGLFYFLAFVQTILHLHDDYDAIAVPGLTPRNSRDDANPTLTRNSPKPRVVLLRKLPSMLTTSLAVTFTSLVTGTFVYLIGPRNWVWPYYYNFMRNVVTVSKSARPSGLAPFLPLVSAFLVEGSLLMFLWQFVNRAFDLYIATEPLKKEAPITSESQDPNGTLLNGLKSRKDAVKAIAFWELALITDAFPDRRKTIYGELDRKKAPTFEQVTDICLGEVKLLIERVNTGLNPALTPTAPAGQQPSAPLSLVSQVAQPLKADKQVLAPLAPPSSKLEKFGSTTSSIAKLNSAPGNAQQAYGREALSKGMKKARDGTQQAESFISKNYRALATSFLGVPFRHSFRRTSRLVVLGAPYSRISFICNAVTALTNLTAFSLKNDDFGRFHQGVPAIIRVFTTAISKIDAYMSNAEIHPSDITTLSKPEGERRNVSEVTQVRECLREGLERIIGSFNEYLGPMGLTKLEILDAKKAVEVRQAIEVSKKPEMIQAWRS